jgi:hypothetical protein
MDLIEKPDSSHRHPWELARFEVVKDIIDHKISDYENKNILDLGCGDLFFVESFSKNKKDTKFYAVDTAFDDDFLKNNGKENLRLFKSLRDLPEENIIFDVIFLMDVIEHIENDYHFLSELVDSKFVDERTLFVITVPAFQSLFSSHDYFLKHYRRYTNKAIERLTLKSGMQTMEKGYFFFSLLLPRFAEVFLEKITGKKKQRQGTHLTNWPNNSLATKTIKDILVLDYKLQKLFRRTGIRLPGLSNYIVCKKPA